MPVRCGYRSIYSCFAAVSTDTGNFGLVKTTSSSTIFSPSMSSISKLTTGQSVRLFSFSIVVSESDVSFPDRPSCLASFPEQKEVLEPLSRNAYVITVFARPGAFTFTGITSHGCLTMTVVFYIARFIIPSNVAI